MADQIVTVGKERLTERLGLLSLRERTPAMSGAVPVSSCLFRSRRSGANSLDLQADAESWRYRCCLLE